MNLSILGRRAGRVIQAPPSGALFAPNIPASHLVVADTNFVTPRPDATVIDGWSLNSGTLNMVMGGVDTPAYQRIVDPSSVHGGVVGRMNFGDGHVSGGSWGIQHTLPVNQVREVFFAITMRFGPGYVVHTNGFTEKFWYPTVVNGGPFNAPVCQWGTVANNGVPPFRLGTLHFDEAGLAYMSQPQYLANFNFQRETWYHIEIHQRLGSWNPALAPTYMNADGFTRIWVDGNLVFDFQQHRATGSSASAQVHYQWSRMGSTRGGDTSSVPAPFGGMWKEFDRALTAYRPE